MTPVSVSSSGRNPVLDIFHVPKTDTSINDFRISTFSPIGTSITPLEFNVPEVQEFLDLSRSYFTLKLKLTKTDGKPLKTADKLYVVNNLAHSMIKQCVVRLNGTLITPHTDTYPYKAMIETILNYNREDGKTILRPQGWVNALDMPIQFLRTSTSDESPKVADFTDNQKESHKLLVAETNKHINDTDDTLFEVQLRFKPHVEPFWFPFALRPGIQIQIQFHFNDPKFFTYRTGTNTSKNLRLNAEDVDMRFHMCRLRLNSSVYNDLMLKLSNSTQVVRYPVVRSEVRTFSWKSKTVKRFEEDDLFQGRIPQRMVVGILRNEAFTGDADHYPHAFSCEKISSVKQIVGGEEYPYESLLLGSNDENDYVGYFRWLQASGVLIKGQPNMIREADWGDEKNCSLFMFNNVGGGNADIGMFNPHKRGDLRLEIELTSVTSFNTCTVVVLGEFENIIETNSLVDVDYDIYR